MPVFFYVYLYICLYDNEIQFSPLSIIFQMNFFLLSTLFIKSFLILLSYVILMNWFDFPPDTYSKLEFVFCYNLNLQLINEMLCAVYVVKRK